MPKLYPGSSKISLPSALLPWVLSVGLSLTGVAPALAQTRPQVAPPAGLTLLPAVAPPKVVPEGAALAYQTRQQWAGHEVAAADLRISNSYTDAQGLTYTYVQQLHAGIPVYNQLVTLVFKDGKLRHHAGTFVGERAFAGVSATPAITAATATARAVTPLATGRLAAPVATGRNAGPEQRQTFAVASVSRRELATNLVWVLDAQQRPHLAWNVNVELLDSPDWLNIRLDAATGQKLDQDNWTVHEAPATGRAAAPNRAPHAPVQPAARPQSQPGSTKSTQAVTPASYRVVPFPNERPDVTTPTIDTNPWLRAGASNAATTYGWHFDGTTNYLDTRGNNVWAYDDSLNRNTPGRFTASTGTSSSLLFDDVPDLTQAPTLGRNRRAATTNLFYWNNLMHDVMYQYGFTEATGNFQTDNQGRGGTGGDYVRAEAQDGGGTNNANFATPPDGTSGRMQMYLFSGPAKVNVTAPANAVASYAALEGAVSTNNKLANVGTVTGPAVFFNDAGSPATHDACGTSATSLTGKIALISSYTCAFTAKIKAAQTAGAIGVIVLRSVAGGPAFVMGGTDNTITIPAVMVSYADGITLSNLVGSGLMVSIPVPLGLDGDFDSGVMSHEYGHGISNRLTGGPANASCLYNAEQAGEGWSDFFALMMTTDWTTAQTTDGPNARPEGTYANGQAPTAGGIRRYPYSTNMSVNPLTYASMAASTEAHDIGEIWCATVWDMTWNIIQMQGTIEPNLYNSAGTGGNAVALNLVMQGLKLQPCSPGFLDGRDAILAADSLLYGGRYHCAIWSAFARRGMGYSAKEGSSNSATDQTAAYDVPTVRLTKNATPLVGNQFAINITATCECVTAQQPYTLTDQLPADVQYVSSTGGGTLSGNTVTFSNLTFTSRQQRTFSILAQTAPGKGCAVALPVNDDRDANQVGGLTAAVLTGSGGWAPSTARAHGGTTAWNAPDPSATSNFTLTSAAFTPGSEAVLSFYHYYNTESLYDGGMVAISVNGGTWTDAAAYFLQNGYNATFTSGTASAGKPCFSGFSNGFGQTLVNLSSFSGQSIRLRFQFQSDYDNGNLGLLEGWYLDDIQVLSGCGDLQRITLKASGGTVADSYAQNLFLTAPALALTAITPSPGGLGQAITITGTGLGSPTALSINGANALAGILSNDGSTLVARVPVTAAAAGTVSITTANGTATLPFSVMAAPGNALAFDGVDDYVRPAGTLPATGEFTLEAWVNPTALSNSLSALLLADDFPAGAMHCQFYGNQLGFTVNGNSPTDVVSTVALPLGRWAHVAVVYSASAKTVQFYLNGALVTTGTYTTAGPISATAYSVAAWLTGGTVQRAFNGRLDELRLYSVALTPAQVQADMLSTSSAVPASLALDLNFDQGTPATASTGANTGLTTLYDLTPNATAATLTNFALGSGNPSSNYVASYALVVPTATAATSRLGTSFIATWTAPAIGTETSYVLDVSTTPDFSTPVTGSPFTAAAPATSYGVTGLTQNTAYYYRVRALNSNLTDQGAYSNSISVATPLPVTLVSFTAQAEGLAAVHLRWATASELNSQAFEVERSTDGVAFANIGTVAAAGTTTAAHTYALLDAALPTGPSVLYYRLRQVDRDGSASYSSVRVVALAGGAAALYVYPNPATGAATLVGAETGASVQLLDALGRVVATTSADATGKAFLPGSLPAGMYIVRSSGHAVRWSVQ